MNRKQFMEILRSKLANVPESERQEAIEYYEDYLNDAGIQDDDIVPESIGDPESIVENIMQSLKDPDVDFINEEKVVKNPPISRVKAKFSSLSDTEVLLIIIIAILTSPIWGSIVLGAGGTLFGIAAGVVGVFIGFTAAGIGLIAGGIALVTSGIVLMTSFIAEGLLVTGIGLLFMGIGLMLSMGMIKCIIMFVKWIVSLVRKLIGSSKAIA